MNDIFAGLTDRELIVLSHLHKNGPATKSGVMENLNIRPSTLNRAMKTLKDRNLIFESGISDSSGGRRPSEFDVVHDGVYAVGVDISRTYAQTVLMNMKNQVLDQYRFGMDDRITPQECVGRIADAIRFMTSKPQIEKGGIIGIGVGTVGPMSRENGVLLHPKGFPNPEWRENVPLRDLFEQRTGIRCSIDNGANTAALLEYYFGAGRDSKCVAYIHCGVGIRSAVIRNGRILRTMNDSEDAFAQMTIDLSGGCLEDYVSLEAVRGRYFSHTGREISYDELFRLAAARDEPAVEAFDFSAGILSLGISNLAKLLDPAVVILSGPLISNYGPYYSVCMKAFREHNIQNGKTVFSKGGTFKENVVAVGAGLMLYEKYFNQTGRIE